MTGTMRVTSETMVGSFVTMKLGGVEAHKGVERNDFRGLGVHEKTDRLDTTPEASRGWWRLRRWKRGGGFSRKS